MNPGPMHLLMNNYVPVQPTGAEMATESRDTTWFNYLVDVE